MPRSSNVEVAADQLQGDFLAGVAGGVVDFAEAALADAAFDRIALQGARAAGIEKTLRRPRRVALRIGRHTRRIVHFGVHGIGSGRVQDNSNETLPNCRVKSPPLPRERVGVRGTRRRFCRSVRSRCNFPSPRPSPGGRGGPLASAAKTSHRYCTIASSFKENPSPTTREFHVSRPRSLQGRPSISNRPSVRQNRSSPAR